MERIGDRWAGDWATTRLIHWLRTWYCWFAVSEYDYSLQRQEKERAGGGFARSRSDV